MPPTQMPPARSRGVGWCELRAPALWRGGPVDPPVRRGGARHTDHRTQRQSVLNTPSSNWRADAGARSAGRDTSSPSSGQRTV